MIRVLLLSMTLWLSGCALFQAPPAAVNPVVATNPQDAAQATINAGLSAILAYAQTTRSDNKAGLITTEDANADLTILRNAKSKLDTAQKFLDAGSVNDAQGQAAIAAQLIELIRLKVQDRVK